jgi:beta-glucosidase
MTAGRFKRALLALSLAASVVFTVEAQAAPVQCAAWMDPRDDADHRAAALLKAMSEDQKLQMLVYAYPPWQTYWGTAGHINAIPELCVPALVLADAGSGVAGTQVATTLFPAGVAQASTWDPVTQRAVGRAIGAEAFDKGINVMLAPGMNMARTPYGGRNFEYLGEDPFLSASTGVAFVKGIQDNPVLASGKHFALNDQETDRNTGDVEADERTMRELYLPPFEAAVKQARIGSLMCAYNKVHTKFSCENPELLNGFLRRDWGFKGFVESDWGAAHSTVPSVRAGMDLEMGTDNFYSNKSLRAALVAKQISWRQIDAMVTHIVQPMFEHGLFDHPTTQGPRQFTAQPSTPQHQALARQAAVEGTVMLRNRNRLLPLPGEGGHVIAVIGYAANPFGTNNATSGSGSSRPPAPRNVSPLEGITAQARAHGDTVIYTEGDNQAEAAAVASAADYVVVVATDIREESKDKPDLSMHPGLCTGAVCSTLPLEQEEMVSAVVAANPRTTVVLDIGGPVRMPWLSKAGAVLVPWYNGQEHGNALASILYGEEEPGGRLPQTFPVDEKQVRYSPRQFPGVNGTVTYTEKLLMGYRWYDAKGQRPLFPFGFGLGYTTFSYSDLHVQKAGSGATVTFRVRNTGARRGSAVPQVYVSFPRAAGEPPKQLKGFEKVTLDPGQTDVVTVRLDKRAFSYWKSRRAGWTVAPGTYRIMLAESARDVVGIQEVRWDG